ncbi:MAG: hypothetical protein Q9187_005648 [Circinaria calcarea]
MDMLLSNGIGRAWGYSDKASTTRGDSVQLELFMQQPAEDAAILRQLDFLRQLIDQHASQFYHSLKISFLQSTPDGKVRTKVAPEELRRMIEIMDEILGPFENDHSREGDQSEYRVSNLKLLVKRTAEIGAMLFAHPATWAFSWESPGAGVSRGGNFKTSSTPIVVFPAIMKTSDLEGRELKNPIEKAEAEKVWPKEIPSKTSAGIRQKSINYRDLSPDGKHGDSKSVDLSLKGVIPANSIARESFNSSEGRLSNEVPGAYPSKSSESRPDFAQAQRPGLTESPSPEEAPTRIPFSENSTDAHSLSYEVDATDAKPGHQNHQFSFAGLRSLKSKAEAGKPRTKEDIKKYNSRVPHRRPYSSSRTLEEDPWQRPSLSLAPVKKGVKSIINAVKSSDHKSIANKPRPLD